MRLAAALAALLWLALGSLAAAQPAGWSPQPWLEDLAQMRAALETRYANRSWLEQERGVDLPGLFARNANRIRAAGSDAAARAIFDRMMRRINDGHVELDWPSATAAPAGGPPAASDSCSDMGFDADQASPGVSTKLTGYTPLPDDLFFPAGILEAGGHRIGVVRIGVFQPQGSPAACKAALAALRVPPGKPCDEACQDRVLTWTYARMTDAFASRLQALRSRGAQLLLVDLSGNGGGSEWAEAAVRMVSPLPLRSERLGFVRTAGWVKSWDTLAQALRNAASENSRDRARLLAWAGEADRAKAEAAIPCIAAKPCPPLPIAGYATGLVGASPAGALPSSGWGPLVFSAAQYRYRDGVWSGPLLVLVDDETWSAAEEFAAVVQDNHAGVVLGTRTGGAGCGHTDAAAPVTLARSRAVLQMPDCARFRADGSNEVRGVIPDVLVGIRASDGIALEAKLVDARLADAAAGAIALAAPH